MKKVINYILIFAIIFSYFIYPYNAYATITATVVDKDGANIRKGAGTNYASLGVVNYKQEVTLLSTTKTKGTGCDGWYQVSYKNQTGYICSELVSVKENVQNTKKGYYTSDSFGARVNENYANVRSSTSMSATVLDKLYLGTKVNILETINKSTSNCSEGWYKIAYYNSKTGYVCKRLIDKYEDVTAKDAEYEKTLKDLKFPDSYIPFLVAMHKKHPTWTFKPDFTNKDFATAVDKETGKNLIQSTIDAYITSGKGEAGGWKVASSGFLAMLLDPRNYLNETNIWVFEDLSFDEEHHTKETIKSVFKGTYLEADEYLTYFYDAGKKYNISPIHLASRVKQEGGTNENYEAVSGKSTAKYNNESLSGYYNYYNIGAYADNVTESPVTRGLAVAKGIIDGQEGTPWDTREKAIKYGAKFLADGYINNGQNTLYYQKFNTKNGAHFPSYTHQYMTNVLAPSSESLSVKQTYIDNNLMDISYTFAIPVYNNMPTEYLTYPPIGDTTNTLNSIKVDNKEINGFDKDVLEYTHYIPMDKEEVEITVDKTSSKSTVTGIGKIKTSSKETKVTITVTSEILETKTYTLTLIKEQTTSTKALSVDEIIDKLDVKLSDNYLTSIAISTLPATIANDINKIEPTAKVTITDKNNKQKTTQLATGDIIEITSNNETKKYTISIKGDINGDGIINSQDFLRIQKHILGYIKLANEYKASADVNYDNNINSQDFLRIQKHILGYIKIK